MGNTKEYQEDLIRDENKRDLEQMKVTSKKRKADDTAPELSAFSLMTNAHRRIWRLSFAIPGTGRGRFWIASGMGSLLSILERPDPCSPGQGQRADSDSGAQSPSRGPGGEKGQGEHDAS